MTDSTPGTPPIPPETHAAVAAWMRSHGWDVTAVRWEPDPDIGFFVWQEDVPQQVKSHALWVAESMVRQLSAEQLIEVLNSEKMAEEIRFSFKVRIQERGAEYRVSIVPRRSGEFRKLE